MSTVERNTLVILIGLPGSGKSTVAEWMSQLLGYEIVSRDSIRAAMFPRCTFTDAEKGRAYEAMRSAIRTSLSLGRSVVTDGMCFSTAPQLEEVEALTDGLPVSSVAIHCDCPVEVAKHRVRLDREAGSHPALDRDEALVDVVAARFRSLPDRVVSVRTDRPFEQVAEAVASALERLR